MASKRLFLAIGAILAGLSLLPGIVLAEQVELPSKTVFMGAWEIYDTGGVYGAQPGLISRVDAYYAASPHIYYRVLVFPDGTEQAVDSYKFVFGATGTHHQTYPGHMRTRFWAEGTIPAATVEVSGPGDYSVELRHVAIPKPTAEKFPGAELGSVVDWYKVERVKDGNAEHDKSCTRAVGWVCWREIKVAEGVKVSDYAQVYETYSFTVESLAASPSLTGPLTGATSSPFSSSRGKDGQASAGALPLTVMGLAAGAGLAAVASRKVKITTVLSSHGAALERAAAKNKSIAGRIRARYKAWLRFSYWGKKWGRIRKAQAAERRRNERLMMAELANMERMHTDEQKASALARMKKRYAGRMRKKYETELARAEKEFLEGPPPKKVRRDVAERRRNERLLEIEMNNWERMYTVEQKAAALGEMKRKYRGKVRKKFEREIESLEKSIRRTSARNHKVVHAKSFTPGPRAVWAAPPVGLIPIEDGVDEGALNFGEAVRLKENHAYELPQALEVVYENNSLVRKMNEVTDLVYETQTEAIKMAEQGPAPLRYVRKFAHGFAREIGTAVPALVGNTWFALGAVGVTVYDSIRNPKDAGKNLDMLYKSGMGALFRGTREMYRTAKYEDRAVAAGAMAAFIIAPEEVLVGSVAGRAGRVVSKGARKGAKTSRGARIGKRGKGEMGIGERATMKSFEHAEGIVEHAVEGGERVSGMDAMKKGSGTFVDFAEPGDAE